MEGVGRKEVEKERKCKEVGGQKREKERKRKRMSGKKRRRWVKLS